VAPGTADLPEDDRVVALDAGDLAPGTLIGRFVVRERLGAGGMGVVYAAEDADLGRPVALKLVRPDADRPGLRARLLREAQAMAHIDHPHVVRVHEVGEHGPHLFLAMELIEGETLAAWLARSRRDWRPILATFVEAGRGLAALHAAGLVHRDVKPDNVLVDAAGRARIADLGLVRVEPSRSQHRSPALAASLTRTGVAMGTPGFMAPEQQRGEKVDAQADQYSFCVALRQALQGLTPEPPRAVRRAVQRGLAFDPADRFESMAALLAALERGAGVERTAAVAVAAVAFLVIAGAAVVAVALGGGEVDGTARSVLAVASPVDAPAAPPVDASAAPPVDASAAPPVDASAAPAGPSARTAKIRSTPAAGNAGGSAATGQRTVGPDGLITEPDGFQYYPPPPFARPHGSAPPEPPKPVLHGLDRTHLPAIRDAIRDLGYRGYSLAALDADVAGTQRDFAGRRDALIAEGKGGDVMVGVADVVLGQIERRSGSCAGALTRWSAATRVLVAIRQAEPHERTALLWLGRIHLGRGLCRLHAGDLAGAEAHLDQAVQIGWGGGDRVEQAEVALAAGIARYERGDLDDARARLLRAGREGDDRVRTALEAWMAATGATLR
jgi:hypothetical protein